VVVGQSSALIGGGESFAPSPVDVGGLLEYRVGVRIQNDHNGQSMTLGEVSLQVEKETGLETATFTVITDFIFDPAADVYTPSPEFGECAFGLGQMNAPISPAHKADVKPGVRY